MGSACSTAATSPRGQYATGQYSARGPGGNEFMRRRLSLASMEGTNRSEATSDVSDERDMDGIESDNELCRFAEGGTSFRRGCRFQYGLYVAPGDGDGSIADAAC